MFYKDESAIVLDFLPKGRAAGKSEALAQVLGINYFGLLEVVIKPGTAVKSGDKIYIGEGERKEVERIKRRISSNELTTLAKSELHFVVEKIVKENEAKYVEFYSKSQSLSTRLHSMELLPGIGKKHMWDIIEERKKGPFKSFDDLKSRVKLLPDPVGMIVKRILMEIENENERYRLFAVGPPRREEEYGRRY
jgi:putative nucleotide binding protein